MKNFYVYILSNKPNGTLYIGSTSNLVKRVWEHKNTVIESFTSKYQLYDLVYYEVHESYIEAARREKRLKNWHRKWKIDLIEKNNPDWNDLYHMICN